MREATAHVERDLGAVSLSTGVIWRAERQQGLRQLSDRSFEMFTVSTILRDPGPEGTTLAPDADGTAIQVFDVPTISLVPPVPVVGNVARSNSDYTTWEVTAARRFTGRWSLAASVAHTWSRDHASGYLGQAVRTNEYAVTPNDLINTDEGGRHVFRRAWAAKRMARGWRRGDCASRRSFGTSPVRRSAAPSLRGSTWEPFARSRNRSERAVRTTSPWSISVREGCRGWRRTPRLGLRGGVQSLQCESGADRELGLRPVVPAPAQHRPAAHRAGRDARGLVIRLAL